MPSDIDGYIPESAQAEKHGVSLATLRRWRKQNYGPTAVQIGRKFFYRDYATEEWFKQQESAASEPARRGRRR
jgi:hypothetical protein